MPRTHMLLTTCGALLAASMVLVLAEQQVQFQTPTMPELPNNGLGETDQPLIPGQPWHIRDLNRPKPVTVTPAKHLGDPPSDAIVLFDGKDLSQWTVGGGGGRGRAGGPGAAAAAPSAPQAPVSSPPPGWKVTNGYMEVTPGAGSLSSKERFKDFQLHLEFASPTVPLGISQYRGNSGVTLGGREIQILDNYDNQTYADGYVAAVYNQWPPLANPSRPPGEWQTLDIAYFAARYDGDKLVRNAYLTIFMNGVLVHDNREILPSGRGAGAGRSTSGAGVGGPVGQNAAQTPPAGASGRGPAIPPGGDQPIGLMGHPSAIPGNAVRYRNIWVRRVAPELPTPSVQGQN
jgi:3-keto-disaccharide hydrolase